MFAIRLLFLVLFLLPACHQPKSEKAIDSLEEVPLMYAKGFSLFRGNNFYVLEIIQSPEKKQRFLVYDPEEEVLNPDFPLDGKIPMGSHKVILSATPQVAHLDYLHAEDHLMAFPDLDLISSESIRRRIDKNKIIDLGKGPMTNMEKIIDLQPDWVMISGFGEPFKLADRLGAANIPVIINQEFLEKHPLGRAEWIKVTGVLLGKEEEATAVYSEIVANYNASSELVAKGTEGNKPSVLSGSLYKDIWYAPGKDSWAAKIIADAGGHYLFDNKGDTGSLTLNYEFVLDQGGQADYWIGAANYASLGSMVDQNPKYGAFKAFKEKRIYTYTLGIGATGGLRYFEEGYLRPDLVLLDKIKILHPKKAVKHNFRFFEKLEE